MTKKAIVICGYLASGKSTFALRLARELNVPYLIKDTFKSAICRDLPIEDRSASSRFSAATFNAMLYMAERLMEAGAPVILEGNFVPAGVKPVDEAGELRGLMEKYGYSSLTYKFTGDTAVLYRRFIERENTPGRGRANRIGGEVSQETFDSWCRAMDGFGLGGETVEVDATDFASVDYDRLIRAAMPPRT